MSEKFMEPDFDAELELSDICDTEQIGMEQAVFIKGDSYNGKFLWGIYDAEGNRMAVTDNRDCAFVVAKQNDFLPYSVH